MTKILTKTSKHVSQEIKRLAAKIRIGVVGMGGANIKKLGCGYMSFQINF